MNDTGWTIKPFGWLFLIGLIAVTALTTYLLVKKYGPISFPNETDN
jgi:hypothetical protein